MKDSCMISPVKLLISLITAVFSLILAIAMIPISRPGSFALFLLIAILFFVIAIINGSRICMDEQKVSRMLFHFTFESYSWDDIKEVGVASSKVFQNDGKGKHVGNRYIYFSKTVLSEDDRFEMMLHWPVRDKLYMEYNPERLSATQVLWSGDIETYKAGDLFL
mgnify:FL=1